MPSPCPDFPLGTFHSHDRDAGIGSSSPALRQSLEAFIARRFAEAYGAEVEHFCRELVGLRYPDGAWRAGVGYTPAGSQRLHLEHYLDASVEEVIARAVAGPVLRDAVVEVGNLAAASAGAAREIVVAMESHLQQRGYAWVVFTATRELRNTFARLRMSPIVVARADPARLPCGGSRWGRYYDNDPMVVVGALRDRAAWSAAA